MKPPLLLLAVALCISLLRLVARAETPAAGLLLPNCFSSNMVISSSLGDDDWLLWGWIADDSDLGIVLPGGEQKPISPTEDYFSDKKHPGLKLWYLSRKRVPKRVQFPKDQPFDITFTITRKRDTARMVLTNVVFGKVVALGVTAGTFPPPANRITRSPNLRLLKVGSLAWEQLLPKDLPTVLPASWTVAGDLPPDAALQGTALYLLGQMSKTTAAPVGVILYPHPSGVQFTNQAGRSFIGEARADQADPLLGVACREARSAAGEDYALELEVYRRKMIDLKREVLTLPPPRRPSDVYPFRVNQTEWKCLRLDAIAW